MAKLPDETALGRRPSLESGGIARYQPAALPGASNAEGDALEYFGRVMGQNAAEMQRAIDRESERQDRATADDAFNKLREKQLELSLGKDGYTAKRGNDAVNKPLIEDYNKRFDDATNEVRNALKTPRQRDLFNAQAQNARLQFQGGLMTHIAQERQSYEKAVAENTMKVEDGIIAQNWADPNAVGLSIARKVDAVNAIGDAYGWKEDDPQRVAAIQHAKTGAHAIVIQQAIEAGNTAFAEEYYKQNKKDIEPTVQKSLATAVRQGVQRDATANYQSQFISSRDDLRALKTLSKAVTADKTLDLEHKNVLLQRIESRQDVLEMKVRADQERFLRDGERAINAINTNTLQGFEPTPEQVAPLLQRYKGTTLEPQIQQMLNIAGATRQFRTLPTVAQEQALTDMEARARKDPTKVDLNILQRFRSIHDAQKAQVRADPLGFAIGQGFVSEENIAAKPLDLTKPDTLGPQLAERFSLGREISLRYQTPLQPLRPGEVKIIQADLATRGPEAKAAYFSQLFKASGSDKDGYRAIMAQLAPDDPVTAAAGIKAGRAATPQEANTALSILRGQAYLTPPKDKDGKPLKNELMMPPDKDLERAFNDRVGNAFDGRPGSRSTFLQTARAIYADKIVQSSNFDGVLDTKLWRQAVDEATGGIVSYKGSRTILPPNTNEDQFKDGVAQRLQAAEFAGRLPEGKRYADIKDLPLEAAGDGRYIIKSGDSYVPDPDRKDPRTGKPLPLVIDFNEPVGALPPPKKHPRTGKPL